MTEGLTGGISPEALAALQKLSSSLPEASERPTSPQGDRVSLKDAPYLDILQKQPELAETIGDTMDRLTQAGLEVPVFHVTSRAIRFPDGSEQSTGYLENISQNGFRARDTNVAAFMERSVSARIADPGYFADNPHKFLRAMAESMGRYVHHGSRTNKQTLDKHRDAGVGLPTMVVIDASGVPLVPGSDYDDHFMLGEVVPSSRIIGNIDLTGRKPINLDDVTVVAEAFLKQTEQYASNSQALSEPAI